MRSTLQFALGLALALPGICRAATPEVIPLIDALRSVDSHGKNHKAASAAWSKLTSEAGAEHLPEILAGMDGANPLAANWLRAAVDAIAERHMRQKGPLPLAGLERFLSQTDHNPKARRQAFEWIARQDPGAPDRWIPTMLDDPSLEMRRDAIARLLETADKALAAEQQDEATATFEKALASARDLDQVKSITEALKKLGKPVDLPSHYGFLQDWKLVGPFDNRAGKGYDTVYPPEETLDLKAEYATTAVPEGKVKWIDHHTDDEYGAVDLNKAIGKHMGVAGYAVATFVSDKAQTVDVRLGSENANKVWLNGKPLMAAEVYHANGTLDQYIARGELKPGKNVFLLKICQDEQTVDWAQNWTFQLRVCDSTGKAILSTDRPAPKKPADQTAQLRQE